MAELSCVDRISADDEFAIQPINSSATSALLPMTPLTDSGKSKKLSENEVPVPIDSFFATPSVYDMEHVDQVANHIAEAIDRENT